VEKTRNSVFTVADNKAKRKTIKTGFNDAGSVEVLEGCDLNEQYIVVGKQVLADGQPVTIAEGK
jgi:hypothetical protein